MKCNVNVRFYATWLALVVLSASLLLTSCNDSMLGADMDSVSPGPIITAPPPIHHVIIESIEVLEISTLNSEEEYWDIYSSDGPDLAIQLRAIGEDVSGVSEFLTNARNDEQDEYTAQPLSGRCVTQLTGALLSEGDLPFHVPLNFEGFLELLDQDIYTIWGGSFTINDFMTSFEFHPVNYQENTPHSILLTAQDHCRYSIRLQVRWI